LQNFIACHVTVTKIVQQALCAPDSVSYLIMVLSL